MSNKLFRPFGNYVLLTKPTEETTESGIVLPITTQGKHEKGTVVAKGDECKYVEVDDVVLYQVLAAAKILVGSDEYFIITEDKLLGAVDKITDEDKPF